VLTSGRGKVGGILLAKNAREAQELVTQMLSMEIKGLPVRRVLVDEAVNIVDAWYLAMVIDKELRTPVMLATGLKGKDQENDEIGENLVKIPIDPLLGLKDYQIRDMAASIGLPRTQWRSFMRVSHGMWRAFERMDATLIEIRPLVVTSDQRLLALDALLYVDDNASFRHPEFSDYWDLSVACEPEVEAHKYGLQYVKMHGNVGCMVNGAGLTMATMDLISQFNGKPANSGVPYLAIRSGNSIDRGQYFRGDHAL
jgi:succinyl-CoA synthetase beta subunit